MKQTCKWSYEKRNTQTSDQSNVSTTKDKKNTKLPTHCLCAQGHLVVKELIDITCTYVSALGKLNFLIRGNTCVFHFNMKQWSLELLPLHQFIFNLHYFMLMIYNPYTRINMKNFIVLTRIYKGKMLCNGCCCWLQLCAQIHLQLGFLLCQQI